MPYRIYADESGTHDQRWLIIGMLFVPDHGLLHSELCAVKEKRKYFNASPKRSARYKETHLAEFRHGRDVAVGKDWVDIFLKDRCYYRSIVVDWSIWQPGYFGDAFDPEALQKRRAYKKWAEMLLHPELKSPRYGQPIYHARFFLDKLKILYGYDVLEHLEDRFTKNYRGESPYIETFEHTDSWRDANQCLQLCDLLTGCLYQHLTPAARAEKQEMREYLAIQVAPLGIQMNAGFWKGYDPSTLTRHFPKFSAWFWRPLDRKERRKKRRGR